jgi:hypothetical protein
MPAPRIEILASFGRSTHSSSRWTGPPKVILTVTSRQITLTIFTWRQPRDPKGALPSHAYLMTNAATGSCVKTTKFMINRTAPRRLGCDLDARFFLTLQAIMPIELPTTIRQLFLDRAFIAKRHLSSLSILLILLFQEIYREIMYLIITQQVPATVHQ